MFVVNVLLLLLLLSLRHTVDGVSGSANCRLHAAEIGTVGLTEDQAIDM